MKSFLLLGLFLLVSSVSGLRAQTVFKDMAPILYANCTSCHHDGGIATDFTKYSFVNAMSATIKSYVNSGQMPPWPADPGYRHYVHERVLNASDKAALIAWIDNGAPAGDTTLAPPAPVYGSTQLFGTPDLILNLPKVTSTATSTDHYYCVNVPSGLVQDRYIRAFEFVPGNASLIHHAVITIDTTGTAVDDLSGGCYNFQGQVGIGDYAPGMGPTVLPGVLPVKFGFRLKAGSTLSFQIHVPEGTAGQQDSSQLRLYFYPVGESGIRPMFFETVLQNWSFSVPANDTLTVTQKYPGASGVPAALSLYGAFPHSHNTCTSILNFAWKLTDTIPLIRIPEWDFHWQMQYTFKNLIKMPQGYRLYSAHHFDNTVNNPHTPNPNVPVVAGTNTDDEMLFDSYLFALYQTGDESVDIEALLLSDPLFYPTQNLEFSQLVPYWNVYPNPSDNQFIFDGQLTTSQFAQLQILDLQGRVLATCYHGIAAAGHHRFEWNGQGMPRGNYMYRMQAGSVQKSGLLSLR